MVIIKNHDINKWQLDAGDRQLCMELGTSIKRGTASLQATHRWLSRRIVIASASLSATGGWQ